ncbi:MAG: response regulator [Labilithrix sp.]|nr:response regulator [Labilithrix sp.]
MRLTLRAKLAAIVGSAALALLVVIATNRVATQRVDDQLGEIQRRQIPKMEIGPRLSSDFASLRRGYQDAVAAHDAEALDRTRELLTRLLGRLDEGRDVLDAAASAAFRAALTDYDASALDVSRRMLAGEGGEALVESIAEMQKRQARAEELLEQVVTFDQRDLATAFNAARAAPVASARAQLATTLACLAAVLALSVGLSRGVVRSLARLEAGFSRFARGAFDEPIVVPGGDEIAHVASEANRMAESLSRLASDRERADWVKTGIVELTHALRGDLDETEVAERAARTLARYVRAPAAALYVARGEDRRTLELLGHHAATRGASAGDAPPSFELGEGLVGEAARSRELVVVDPAPADFLRVRSGLGEGAPSVLVLVPLVRDQEIRGVLELALFEPLSAEARELLLTARENVAVSLAVAAARAATRELLARTQGQATRLLQQEEELKATNEELRCQQEELRQTNEELAAHARELARQRIALEAKNADLEEIGLRFEQKAAELATVSTYKSQFLANMSHELRTPLNSMLLLSKLLADNAEQNLTAKQIEYARTVHSAGKDLLFLINQVLDLAKVEAGKQTIHLEPVRVEDVVERVRQVFTPLASEKGLALVVEIAKGAPEIVTTDAQRLGQILTNLVGNAIKFTERGAVKLAVHRPAGPIDARGRALAPETTVAFSVSDTGSGIAPEHQARVFVPFEQLDGSTQRRQGGTGLGLGIARELAALLGGDLQLQSVLGQGSTFVCYLPEGGDRPSAPGRARPRDEPSDGEASRIDLLVVEDDPTFAAVLGQIIEERGLVYSTARDGATGLRLARERRPRGIILDVKLPDLDGWQVMEQLRANPSTASIPVHFISGVEMPERGLAMGAAGYLTKPAEREDLVRVIEALGPKRDRATHRVLVVDDDEDAGESLVEQLARGGLQARRATNTRHALDLLEQERFACLILDPSVPDSQELELLEALQRRGGADMPAVVVYTSRQLSRPEVARLEAYVETVILKDGQASAERLLDEIRLFVRRLEGGLPRRSLGPRRGELDVRLEGKKVLVVDDDMRTAYALSATLRAKGAEVLVAETGAVALDVLAATPDVDAILMDVMMPEMDGHEATRRIRRQPAFARLPIVALTAKAMKGDEARCLEAGASAYLPKPIDADALLELLHAQLRPAGRDHG